MYKFFKNSIRFLILLIMSIIIFIGGYLYLWSEDLNLIDKSLRVAISKYNKESLNKIDVSKIKENWSIYGLELTSTELNSIYEEKKITLSNLSIKVDIVKSIIEKKLIFKKISIGDLKIKDFNNLKEKTKVQNNGFSIDSDLIKMLSEIDIKIENINISIKEKNIKINNISMYKNAFENKILTYKNNKTKIYTSYEYSKEENKLKTKSFVISNYSKVIKIIKSLGHEDFINLIEINKIYSIYGDLNSELEIEFDLSKKEISKYSVNLLLEGNKILLRQKREITLTNVIGLIKIDEKGLNSNKLSANLNNKKTNLKITQNKSKGIFIDFKTMLNTDDISKIINYPINNILSGTDIFEGRYELNYEDKDYLFIKSEFKNIDYKSTTNFKKENNFELEAFIDYKKNNITSKIKQGNNYVNLKYINNSLYNITISLNKKIIKDQKQEGVFINGFLEKIDILELISDIKKLNEISLKETEENSSRKDLRINISLKNTKIKNNSFKNINLIYQGSIFSLLFDEDKSTGRIEINNATKEIKIIIDKLNIQTEKTKEVIIESNKIKTKKNINLDGLYKLDVKIENIIIDDMPPIKIKTKLNYINGKIKTDSIDISDYNNVFNLKAIFEYSIIEKKMLVKGLNELTPILELKDVSKFKNNFMKTKSAFKSENIKIFGDIFFIGDSIIDIEESLRANLSLFFEKGVIPKKSKEVGLVKTLNILNIESILQIVLFNFEEMEDGIPFNSIKGYLKSKDGRTNINPRIIIDSDLFMLEIEGYIDHKTKKYNFNVVTIVPIINKIPLIALFTGVAPEIVGFIWLIDKLAGEELNSIFSKTEFNLNGKFEIEKN